MKFDLVIVGGGAGGIGAARTAAQFGRRPLMVQKGAVGGDCTFTGCVPSKALVRAAGEGRSFDEAMAAQRAAVERIAARETAEVLGRGGIAVIDGWARLVAPDRVEVDGTAIRAPRIVIATGASPRVPPIEGLDSVNALTSDEVFSLATQPESLVVLGAGAVGCEMAQAFARMGTRVALVEMRDRVLPGEEPVVSDIVASALAADGVEVHLGVEVARAESTPLGARLHSTDGRKVDGQRMLMAVGRRPFTRGLGLEELGIETGPDGSVRTDDRMRTSLRHVYAVGDVTGRSPLTHAADEMGRVAAWNALRRVPMRFRGDSIPRVVFTDPEVASVGATSRTAPPGSRLSVVPMSEIDRAIVAERTEGLVQLVASPRRLTGRLAGGRVVGGTVVGSRAGEVIAEIVLAVRTGMTPLRLAQTVHAYPTWTTGTRIAAAQFFFDLGRGRAGPVGS